MADRLMSIRLNGLNLLSLERKMLLKRTGNGRRLSLLQGLKFRETHIIKIIEESLSKLSRDDRVVVAVDARLDDAAVWIDREQIVSALVDLERNALEAMPDGGKLTIAVEGDDRIITLRLADTGRGIPEENIPLLFTPFFTTKPVGEGTGLGLPSSYAAVKAHHGDISIASNADPKKGPTGTTVRITLPRKQAFQEKEAKVILHETGD
jgi:signal transduction histidine kinase